MSEITGFQCIDETPEQARQRTLRWIATRNEVRGITDTFIFHGRVCKHIAPTRVVLFGSSISSGFNLTEAEKRFQDKLAQDRLGMLRSRAVREARDTGELVRLIAQYGAS